MSHSRANSASVWSYLKPKNLLLLALFAQAKLMGLLVEADQSNFRVIPIGPLPFSTSKPEPTEAKYTYAQCVLFRDIRRGRVWTGADQNVFYDISIKPGAAACVSGKVEYPHGDATQAVFHIAKYGHYFDKKYLNSYVFVPEESFSDKKGLFYVSSDGEVTQLNMPEDFQKNFLALAKNQNAVTLSSETIIQLLPPRKIWDSELIPPICKKGTNRKAVDKNYPGRYPNFKFETIEVFEQVAHWFTPSESAVQCRVGENTNQDNINAPIAVTIPGMPQDPALEPQDTYILTRLKL